jgi:hypothetical protein
VSATTATAPPATRRRAWRGWAILVIALVAVGIAGALVADLRQPPARGVLDPDSAGPEGTRALAQILREHGVAVTVVRDRESAERLAAQPGTTLAMPDDPTLSDDAVARLTETAGTLVLLDPHSRGIRALFPGARPEGVGEAGLADPDCALPDAQRAGPIQPGLVFTSPAGTIACYPSAGGSALLARADGTAAAIDATALFTNAHLAENGNAALAIGLLGRNPTVVWFVPALADSDAGTPDLGALTPPWVTPAILLLVAAAGAAALWRGRRFGPLVAERLPVTVRANETTEGRARLYERSRDVAHAARGVRVGALARLRRRLALPRAVSPAEVAAALSARTGIPLARTTEVLTGALPTTDRGLVALSDALADLEAALPAASSSERTRS